MAEKFAFGGGVGRLFLILVTLFSTVTNSFPDEFQRLNGWYNNINHLHYGSVESSLIYIAGSAYSDGIWEPNGGGRPDPGIISLRLLRDVDGLQPQRNLTAFFAFFGQFVSGEIVATIASGNIACPVELMPIEIYTPSCSPGDESCTDTEEERKMPFFRVAYDPTTGHHLNNPRRPTNFATSWIDGSFVYSHSTPWTDSLREFAGGRLKDLRENGSLSRNPERVPILNPPPPALHPTLLNPERLFLMGSQKSNQHPPLLAIGMIFHRYHNWLAERLSGINPSWNDEKIFQRSRRFLIAIIQNVIMYEFVPLFVGRSLPPYPGYDSSVDPSVSVEFQGIAHKLDEQFVKHQVSEFSMEWIPNVELSTAAYRFGHSLIPSGFYVRDDQCQFTPVAFCKVWWDGSNVIDTFGLGDVIRGLTSQKMERGDHIFSDGVREKLFGGMRMNQGDLAAANIMRGREEGLADYNSVRRGLGLDPVSHWLHLNPELFEQQPHLLREVEKLYNGSMEDVDLYVAGLLESTFDIPGETFQRILMDQFLRIRSADRFWFQNRKNGIFSEDEILWIESVRMMDIIRNVTNMGAEELPSSAFVYDPGMKCPQPQQMDSQLLGECPETGKFDFFTGSEISFIVSFVALTAFPVLVSLVACLVGWRRNRRYKVQNRFLSVRSTKRIKDTFLASEYNGPKNRKRVQIKLGPGPLIQVMCRRAVCIRKVTIQGVHSLQAWISTEQGEDPLFVLNVPKEYDLILLFSDFEYRSEFVRSFKNFVLHGRANLEILEFPYQEILRRVITQNDRQRKLELFFHSAFHQAFRAKQKHGGALNRRMSNLPSFVMAFSGRGTKRQDQMKLLTMELNKEEFAQALQLTPNSLFVQQMFLLADKDRNGYISYPEFTDVLALLSKGSLEDKMKVLFHMYDFDGSSDLDPSEFSIMIRSLLDVANRNVPEEEVEEVVQRMFRDCGLQHKDKIDFQDFYGFVESHQSVLWNDVAMKSFGLTENEKAMTMTDTRVVVPVVKASQDPECIKGCRRLVCYLENNWNKILILAAFLLISLYLFADYFIQESGFRKSLGYSVGVSRGSAHALSLSYAVLFLTVSRNLMTYLRNTVVGYYFPVDSAIDFHRFVALFSLLLTGLTGVLLVILLSVMFVFSTTLARQHIYQAFWTTHRLYVPLYFLIVLHGSYGLLQSPVFPYYIIGPMIVFIVDWILSLRQKLLVLRIQDANALPSEVLHLCFKLPRAIRFCSGQWVRLACDELSENEFHPFTITSAPHEQNISVHIRAVGPWTKKLYDLFSEKIANHSPFPKMLLQGPFGSKHQDWFKFEVVVLVGAGIGVTPTAAVLKDLVHKVYQLNKEIPCRRVYFVWLARTHQQFEWFLDILRDVERKDDHNLIQIDIFVTQILKDFDIRTTMLYICEHQFQRLSNRSLFTGLRAKTHFGRIDFEQYLRSVQRRNGNVGKVGVFSCGPKSVTRSADAACQKINQSGLAPTFIAHHEVF